MDDLMVFNRWRQCAPTPNTCFLGPTRVPIRNRTSIGSAVSTAECPYTLHWAVPSPSKLPLSVGIWTPSITWFLGPIRVLNPNGISIGSADFIGLTTVADWRHADRQTDRHTDRHTTLLGL